MKSKTRDAEIQKLRDKLLEHERKEENVFIDGNGTEENPNRSPCLHPSEVRYFEEQIEFLKLRLDEREGLVGQLQAEAEAAKTNMMTSQKSSDSEHEEEI